MATPVETAQFVRVSLSLLAGDNGHHTFEHICRHVTKLRITSNVLPATGPVSAGGDQGRDFETFRTYLLQELPFARGFLALASTAVVAFACTIQRDDLRAKFKADITAICGQGTPVDNVWIFSVAEVPVRLRHDLQTWAADEHQITLEIVDGYALAEWLAEPDLYWIANTYLHAPAELAPPAVLDEPDLPDWYAELLEYWQQPHRQPANLGDLFELRHGLRHATAPGPARADLPGWLILMTRLAEQSTDVNVQLHAVYEIVTARTLGVADLRPAEPLIRRCVTQIEHSTDPTALFHASVLVQWCAASAALGHTDLPIPEIHGWIPQLRRHVDQLLEQDWGPNTRAGLLQAAAHLALHVDYTGVTGRGGATLDAIDQLTAAVRDAVDHGELQQQLQGTAPLVDLDGGMQRLLELSQLLPAAPAYPIESFSMLIDLLSPALHDHPLYRRVCDGLDDAVRRQDGDAAVAEKCQQRAAAFSKAGRPLDALREFHRAKVNWFHGDTLSGSLDAIASIVDLYSGLGMHLAAKKYALALAALAQRSQDPSDRVFVPIGLFAAANQDHRAGAWIASAELATIAGLAHLAHAPDPANLDRHTYVLEAADHQTVTALVARQVRPRFEPALWTIFDRGPLSALIRAGVDADADTQVRTEAQWLEWLPDTAGTPFSDAGLERTISCRAFGATWTVHGRNTQDTVLAIEDFTATLQILLVEFAALDPMLIPRPVDIEIRTYLRDQPPENRRLTRMDGDVRRWLLYLPADGDNLDQQDAGDGVLGLAFHVLLGNSLLAPASFSTLMEQAAGNGLFHNLEIGRPYRELATFRDQPHPPLADARFRPLTSPDAVHPRAASPHLQPRSGPGPRRPAELNSSSA